MGVQLEVAYTFHFLHKIVQISCQASDSDLLLIIFYY